MVRTQSADLTALIDEKLTSVNTQSLDLSFNELLDMYESNELDISPDYQRLFRWSEGARSRFIESLLLEMPVPPIYVIEEEEGRYLLIDGLQRISSYMHFRGQLTAPHLEPSVQPGDHLTLADCDIVPELNGVSWNDLGAALKIRLKRSFVRVEVIRRGSDPRFKYHMFKRLNTGGELLTDQQLRNCTIRLLDPKFNDFIKRLSGNEDFGVLVRENLSDEKIMGAYDEELVLRFFALKNDRSSFVHDVRDFLTDYMEKVSDPESEEFFSYAEQEAEFRKTFQCLRNSLGENAFGAYNPSSESLKSGFLVYHYEAFAVGLQAVINDLDPEDSDQMIKLKDLLMAVKSDEGFINETRGGGKNYPRPLNRRIDFVAQAVLQGFSEA
jgi:hypothetical protein